VASNSRLSILYFRRHLGLSILDRRRILNIPAAQHKDLIGAIKLIMFIGMGLSWRAGLIHKNPFTIIFGDSDRSSPDPRSCYNRASGNSRDWHSCRN
jgi:hypothetical protein